MVENNFNTSLAEISQGRLFMYSTIFLYINNILQSSEISQDIKGSLKILDEELYSLLEELDNSLISKFALTLIDKDIKPSETPVLISNIKEFFYYENHDFFYKDRPDHVVNYLYYMIYKIKNLMEHIDANDDNRIANNIKYQLRFLSVHFLPFLSKRSELPVVNKILGKLYSLFYLDYNILTDYYLGLCN